MLAVLGRVGAALAQVTAVREPAAGAVFRNREFPAGVPEREPAVAERASPWPVQHLAQRSKVLQGLHN